MADRTEGESVVDSGTGASVAACTFCGADGGGDSREMGRTLRFFHSVSRMP